MTQTPLQILPPAPPPQPPGGRIRFPPPQPPCPPAGDGGDQPPASGCAGGMMIRPGFLYTAHCCITHFHVSCNPVGGMFFWSVQASAADPDNPPDFSFAYWDQDPTIDPDARTGFVPFQIDGHPGYSDVDETLAGYAAYPGTPPGADAELGGDWAESAFLEIHARNGGFSQLTVLAIPYDPATQTMGDKDNPLSLDMLPFVGCPAVLLGSVTNIFGGGNFPDPTGDTGTPNRAWFWFVQSTDAHPGCIVEPGGGGTGIGSIIDDGSIGTVTVISGETRYCSSDHTDTGECFTDREGCAVAISDADVVDTLTITGPFTATPDPTTPGYFYLDLNTLGLYDLGASTPIAGVCTLDVSTDLGPAKIKLAFSLHI